MLDALSSADQGANSAAPLLRPRTHSTGGWIPATATANATANGCATTRRRVTTARITPTNTPTNRSPTLRSCATPTNGPTASCPASGCVTLARTSCLQTCGSTLGADAHGATARSRDCATTLRIGATFHTTLRRCTRHTTATLRRCATLANDTTLRIGAPLYTASKDSGHGSTPLFRFWVGLLLLRLGAKHGWKWLQSCVRGRVVRLITSSRSPRRLLTDCLAPALRSRVHVEKRHLWLYEGERPTLFAVKGPENPATRSSPAIFPTITPSVKRTGGL